MVDVFLNGGLAHAEAAQRTALEQWRANPLWYALVQNEFNAALAIVAKCVRRAQELNTALAAT